RLLILFRDLDLDVEVAAVVEHAAVDQFELGIAQTAPAVFVKQLTIWIFGLRILVEHPLIGVTRQRVEVEVTLLHVLAVIPLRRHESEIALLQNRIALVPERHRPAEDLVAVADAGDAVLAPAVRLRPRVIVRKIAPRIGVRAVVLAHRPPRAVGEVGGAGDRRGGRVGGARDGPPRTAGRGGAAAGAVSRPPGRPAPRRPLPLRPTQRSRPRRVALPLLLNKTKIRRVNFISEK